MLINKFRLKYGNKPTISKYIDNKVQKFLANDRLTEGNLKSLDQKIGKEIDNRDKKQQILDDVKSQRSQSAYSRAASQRSNQKSRLSAAALSNLDNDNRRSQAGGDAASRRTQSAYGGPRSNAGGSKTCKLRSLFSSHPNIPLLDSVASSRINNTIKEKYPELNELQEWDAIQKFNTMLHFEEQKQALEREAERKRLIREQLDSQIKSKKLKE